MSVSLSKKALNSVRAAATEFIEEESGIGIADYGAALALAMLAAGLVGGYFYFESLNKPAATQTPSVQPKCGVPVVQPLPTYKPRRNMDWCAACGMG